MAEEYDMMKPMMTMMMVVIMASILTTLVVQAAPAEPTFCCPLCEDTCFNTLAELETHFAAAHPTEPIDIIWS